MPKPAASIVSAKPQTTYKTRNPESSAVYKTVQTYFETWLELACSGQLDFQTDAYTPAPFVEKAFRNYLEAITLFFAARSGCSK